MYKLLAVVLLLTMNIAGANVVTNYYLAAKIIPLERQRLLDSVRQNGWQVDCGQGPLDCSHCLLKMNSKKELFFYLLDLPDYDSIFVYTNDLRQKDSLLRFLEIKTVKGVK